MPQICSSIFVGNYKERLDEGWQVHLYFVTTGSASERSKGLVVEIELPAKIEQLVYISIS
jgi:hypothetical protein